MQPRCAVFSRFRFFRRNSSHPRVSESAFAINSNPAHLIQRAEFPKFPIQLPVMAHPLPKICVLAIGGV